MGFFHRKIRVSVRKRNIPIFQYFPLPISILSQNQHFPLVHYFPLHQKCSYISVFSAFSILSTISIFICITIVSAISMFFHQFSFYLSKVGIKRKRFFFSRQMYGNFRWISRARASKAASRSLRGCWRSECLWGDVQERRLVLFHVLKMVWTKRCSASTSCVALQKTAWKTVRV